MKDFKSLKILDRCKGLFEKMGIDYLKMRKIVQIKLLMDQRRVPTVVGREKKKQEENHFRKSLINYGITGIVIGMMMFSSMSLFLKMNMVIGFIGFMIMSTLISDFSSVLLDLNEKNILATRPIDAKTIGAAKAIHICIYLFMITMALAGPALLVGMIENGFVFFIVFVGILILLLGFMLIVTTLLYFLILKIFDGEKLKDFINYFQIIVTVVIIVGYQLIGRIGQCEWLAGEIIPKSWMYLLPTAWFASPFQLIFTKSQIPFYRYASVLSIVIPIVTLIIYSKCVMPYFEKYLVKLEQASENKKERKSIEGFIKNIGKIICKDSEERAFFIFTYKMLGNERKLKLKIYPTIVMGIVFPFIFMFQNIFEKASLSEGIQQIGNSKVYLFLYVTIFFLGNMVLMMYAGESHKGSWIYKTVPIQSPNSALKGAVKSFWIKYYMPSFMIISFICLGLYGVKILVDLGLMLIALFVVMLLSFRCAKKRFPFSQDIQNLQSLITFKSTCINLIGTGGLAGIHFIARSMVYGRIIYGVGIILLSIVLWKISFRTTWEEFE
ncbi:hypothetical protein IZY60_09875 [Lutibacter sp. B2]|nr:hypothetical protein [Lutibacter sp. B2]